MVRTSAYWSAPHPSPRMASRRGPDTAGNHGAIKGQEIEWNIRRQLIDASAVSSFSTCRGFTLRKHMGMRKPWWEPRGFWEQKMPKLVDLTFRPHKQRSFVSRLWFVMKNQNCMSFEILMVRKNEINFQWWDGFQFGFQEYQLPVIPLKWVKFELGVSHWRWNIHVWWEHVV